jgi:hypothetical protein
LSGEILVEKGVCVVGRGACEVWKREYDQVYLDYSQGQRDAMYWAMVNGAMRRLSNTEYIRQMARARSLLGRNQFEGFEGD